MAYGLWFSDLVRVIIAETVTNTMTKSSVGRNGFISLTISCNSSSSKAERNLEGGADAEAVE